ncbi:hypothetical protein ITK70_001565, partial [Campylobacter lari]|nr:hypothetical protein [Campylobacter lari]
VFKPSKAGNVVNMGNINANDVLLIGNKVDIQGGKVGNKNSTTHLVGNDIYIDADAAKLNSNKINVTAMNSGYIQRQMINFANDNYSFGSSNGIVQVVNYQETDGRLHVGKVNNFKKMLTIGNMGNEKDNAIEWWHFAKGWNDNLGSTRSVDEFKLVGNIDFDWQLIDPIGYKDFFTANFNGNGFSLKNILISAHGSAGLFGKIENSNISNMDINGLKFQYSGKLPSTIGGFVSYAKNSNISNINLNNIGEIKGTNQVGGFIGYGKTNDISNITLSNVQGLYIGNNTSNIATIGGFIGSSSFSNYNNITLNNIGDMTMENSWRDIFQSSIGWFVGRSDQIDDISNPAYTPNTFNNIIINNVGNMYITGRYNYSHTLYAGGFAGVLFSYTNVVDKFNNIYINFGENSEIIVNGDFKKSYIGKFAGIWNEGSYDFNNIHIYHKQGLLNNATSDVLLSNDFDTNGYMQDKINIHTNENSFITDVLNNEDLKQVGLYLDENGNLSFYTKVDQNPEQPNST